MICAQFSAVSMLAKQTLGGKEQERTAYINIFESKKSEGDWENSDMCTPSTENDIYYWQAGALDLVYNEWLCLC